MMYYFGGTLFRHLFERGWPFGVIKIITANAEEAKKLAEKLRKWVEWSKGRKMTLQDLFYELSKVTGYSIYGIRFGLTFDVFRWYEPSRWSYYSYPGTTAIKEGGGVEVTIYPFNEDSQRLFEAYVSFGIAVADIRETIGIPIGVAVSDTPRRIAIIEGEPSRHGVDATCVTAYPKAVAILRKMRWKPEIVLGRECVWRKRFSTETEFANEITELASRFLSLGMMLYKRGLAKELIRIRA